MSRSDSGNASPTFWLTSTVVWGPVYTFPRSPCTKPSSHSS